MVFIKSSFVIYHRRQFGLASPSSSPHLDSLYFVMNMELQARATNQQLVRCKLCNGLQKNSEDDVRLAFDFVPSELSRSAEAQCPSCNVILAGILHSEDGWTLAEDVTRMYVSGLAKKEDSLSLELYFRNDRSKVVLEFYYRERDGLLKSGKANWEAIKPRFPLSGHPLSPAGMEWLNTRLDSCKKKHSLCQSHSNTKLPKRTLFLRVSGNGKADVRLVENGSQLGRYIALSHCWGSSQLCVLNGKTISQFKRSIPWSLLPKTFQDAIIFSAKLGISHIWIDALCIVQNDPEDWEKESAKMADIYQNSFLTLAATASSDGTGGCFSDAKTVAPSEHELAGSQSLVGLDRIFVRTKLQHWAWPPSKASMKLHPLLSRGWAFQERILSPRVLHFCKDELLWECREESLCECGSLPALPETKKQSYVPRNEIAPRKSFEWKTWRRAFGRIKITMVRRNKIPPKWQVKSRIATRIRRHNSYDSIHDLIPQGEMFNVDAAEKWHRIIEQYSSLSLTEETDRLPALSGLAIRSSPVLGEYIAGIWKHSLVSDLLWRINELEHDIIRPTQYIAPSWSWASVTGPVSFWPESDTRPVERVRYLNLAREQLMKKTNSSTFTATVQVSRLNPYGKVSSGALHVHGHVQPARLQYVSTRVGGQWGTISPRIEPVVLKYELEIMFSDEDFFDREAPQGRIPSIELPFFADYVLRAEGPLRIPHNEQVHLLLMHPYFCLVLKSLDAEMKTFRRIGIIRQPVALVSEYEFSWMKSSIERDIQIL